MNAPCIDRSQWRLDAQRTPTINPDPTVLICHLRDGVASNHAREQLHHGSCLRLLPIIQAGYAAPTKCIEAH